MKMFNVVYDAGDGEEIEIIRAVNAGQAFAKCIEIHPDAKMIKAYCEGSFGNGYGITTYEVPSLKSPEPLPTENLEQSTLEL